MDELEKEISDFIAKDRLVKTVRKLLPKTDESQNEKVPVTLLEKVRSRLPGGPSALCPHCRRPITPFKKPLSRQKWFNGLWFLAGCVLLGVSFFHKHFFMQWVVLGALCIAKWIVDQKSTKTQIMIYKALSEDAQEKTRHLHRVESNL